VDPKPHKTFQICASDLRAAHSSWQALTTFERFTDRARRVLVLAQEEARLLNHDSIGPEHILLGLLMEGEGVAARVLEKIEVTAEELGVQVERLRPRGDGAPSGSTPFTREAKKTLELSLREALQLGHDYIGTEHLLLALVQQEEEMGAQLLASVGIDPSQVREQVAALLTGYLPTKGERMVVRQVVGERSASFRDVGKGWVASVTRAGRTPGDYEAAYEDLKDMFESIGVDLGGDDLANIVVVPVITNEGPGISVSLGHLMGSE
jgi:hypothetical protein